MTTYSPSRWMTLIVIALLVVMTPAFAQKKKKESPAPAPAQVESRGPQKMGMSIKDVLVSLQGQQTNIGLLVKVTGDYVTFEAEGDTLIYPLSAIQVVKFLKTEENEPRKIDIKFLSKD